MIPERAVTKSSRIESGNRQVCKIMDMTEETLTLAAILPVYGTLAGMVKITIGISQSTLAVNAAILVGIPLALSGNNSLLKCSWSHTKHGVGNIIAGTIEGIPGVGASIAFREKKMPYSALT